VDCRRPKAFKRGFSGAKLELIKKLERSEGILRQFLPLATDQTRIKENYEDCVEELKNTYAQLNAFDWSN
jgi:hypothetical protein